MNHKKTTGLLFFNNPIVFSNSGIFSHNLQLINIMTSRD